MAATSKIWLARIQLKPSASRIPISGVRANTFCAMTP